MPENSRVKEGGERGSKTKVTYLLISCYDTHCKFVDVTYEQFELQLKDVEVVSGGEKNTK
jgi:hypothetical protein